MFSFKDLTEVSKVAIQAQEYQKKQEKEKS